MSSTTFHREVLKLDAEKEVSAIVGRLRADIIEVLRKRGGVVGVSGGVDSALVLALAARALGGDRVIALLMPEKESNPDSLRLGRLVCRQFGVEPVVEDITPALEGIGAYRRRDEAARLLFPEYDATHRLKVSLPGQLLDEGTLNVYSATIISPDGRATTRRLRPAELRQIMAATNFKQRCRAAVLYYYAEWRDLAVIGTPPKNEHDLGFFVKHGDGAMDVKPIAHLYKTQVYQLAEYLGVPDEVLRREPTADTFSAGSTQEELYFRIPYRLLDLLWYALDRGISLERVCHELELDAEQATRAFSYLRQRIALGRDVSEAT